MIMAVTLVVRRCSRAFARPSSHEQAGVGHPLSGFRNAQGPERLYQAYDRGQSRRVKVKPGADALFLLYEIPRHRVKFDRR
jgi:hypothetical protein